MATRTPLQVAGDVGRALKGWGDAMLLNGTRKTFLAKLRYGRTGGIRATWTARNLEVVLLEECRGRYGETRYMVCKPTALDNLPHGMFSIRANEIGPVK